MKIKKPFFWSRKNFFSLILYPLSLIAYLVNYIKKKLPKKKFKIKTICVGNVYLGGTGKTTLSIKINKILSKKNKTVFIKKKYLEQIDEQKILKKNGNLICFYERKDALLHAEKKGFSLAILDDGLQQKDIHYDMRIVCFNSKEAIGNGFLLPAGPLRENINEIKNYDAIFIIGEQKNHKLYSMLKQINKSSPIFECKYKPINLSRLSTKKKYLMFTGIGNPHEFEQTLNKYKFNVKKKFIYPDHYKFKTNELNYMKKLAKDESLNLITTEKDFLRLNKNDKRNVEFLNIELKIKNQAKFEKFLKEQL